MVANPLDISTSSKRTFRWLAFWFLGLSCGLIWALLPPAAHARDVLDLDAQAQPIRLKDWGDYWIDVTGRARIEQAAKTANTQWQPTHLQIPYPLTMGQALWIRFTVPPAPDKERWYLEIPFSSLNGAWLYTLDAAGQWQEQHAGDLLAVNSWPVPNRHPLLPIALSAEVPTSYLVRIEHNASLNTSMQFVSESYLNRSEQKISLFLGIFFGLAGLAILVCVFNAVVLRDAAHGLYALRVVLLVLTQASLTGIAGLHLWPQHPWWNDIAPSVFATLEAVGILLFIGVAVSLVKRSVQMHRMLLMVAMGGVGIALALGLITPAQRLALLTPWVISVQILVIYLLVWSWYRGDRFAMGLLVGFSPMLITACYLLMSVIGLVPVGWQSEHAMQIGLSFELPVILVVLMWRCQQRRGNSQRIQGLDRIDPATGLLNEHTFMERLERMITRSQRFNHSSAVILIELVNSEHIRRVFGRRAADTLPLHVAERLLSTAREIDSAARLSEFRFGMLVEGPFSAEEAATLGPRIVARCLMPYKGLPVDCVAQIRVAYALVPRQGPNAAIVLARLDSRLHNTSVDDKRAVFMISDYVAV